MALQHLRSSTANKRPTPAAMSDGQIALNSNTTSPGLFFKDSAGALIKVGPVHVGTTAPNASPASGGETGNSVGEQWLDTTGGAYVFKIWDGSAWRSETGTFVDVNGDTMTGALGIIAGSASTPGLFISGDTNSGIYSPGANQISVATDGTERLRIDSTGQIEAVSLGTGAAPAYSWTGDPNTGIYSPGAGQVAISTNGTERMRLDSSGRLGLGTSTVGANLHIASAATASALATVRLDGADTAGAVNAPITLNAATQGTAGAGGSQFYIETRISGGGLTRALTIDSSQRVGIGTTSPTTDATKVLHVASSGSGTNALVRVAGNNGTGVDLISGGDSNAYLYNRDNAAIAFGTNNTERARLDSSGRLLVGTSSTSEGSRAVFQGWSGDASGSAIIKFALGAATPAADQYLAYFDFTDSGHLPGARFGAQRDGGTWSASSKPSRLVFSTTANSAASPTNRLIIYNGGYIDALNCPALSPLTDNATSLGVTGQRWSAVWAANGTIQTSDVRAKTEITDGSLGSEFVKSLRPVSYKWIEGGKRHTGEYDEDNNFIYESVPGTRTHWGFIAQEVKQAVDAAGVDFGGWVLTDKDDPDSQQALRYDQFIAPLTKALQETMAELEALKAEVAALKAS